MNYPFSDVVIHCMPDYLEHHGIKGQQWGIRRFQNPDGSLTPEGEKRYLQNGGRDGNTNLNLRGLLSPNVKKGKYQASVIKKQSSANLKKKTAEEPKEEPEEEPIPAKTSTLASNYSKEFSKAKSYEDKAKIVDKIENDMTEAFRSNDKEKFEELNSLWWKARYDAGDARVKECDSLPKGPERDKKLTQLLADSDKEGQDSPYSRALIDKMQKSHGDYLSRDFKSEESRKIASDFDSAVDETTKTLEKFYKEDQKRGKYPKDPYGSGYSVRNKLAADHPEVKEALDRQDSAWTKYCEKVLKDMNIPVNDETLEYIESVIIWN